jgi:hypothetical protein
MTGIDPAAFLKELPIGNYDAPPEGGFVGGVKDIALRAPTSGLAMASQDLARPVDFIAESFGGDFTDDRNFEGDLLDDNWDRSSGNATVGAVADFTSEATRFLAEDLLFRGALRAGTTSAISKVGSVGATEAAALAKNSSVLKNISTLAGMTKGASKGIEAIKLGETALTYGAIGAVQAPANMGAGESLAGYAARDVGMNLVFDTMFGLAGKGISKVSSKYVMPYLRSTKIGNAVDTAAVVSQMGDSADRMVDLMSLNDAQLRSLSDEGRLSKDLAERLIQTKYEPNAPEYSLDGPARSRVYNEMISAGVKEDVANAALAVNDAFAQMATRVGDDVTIDGKVISKIKSVDDWYDRQTWRAKADVPATVGAATTSPAVTTPKPSGNTMRYPTKMLDSLASDRFSWKSIVEEASKASDHFQKKEDDLIDSLVASGMTVEKAMEDPTVKKIRTKRVGYDFVTTKAVNDGVSDVILSLKSMPKVPKHLGEMASPTVHKDDIQYIVSDIYGLDKNFIAIASKSEAFVKEEDTLKKLATYLLRSDLTRKGLDPESVVNKSISGLNEEGIDDLLKFYAEKAQNIHNQIKKELTPNSGTLNQGIQGQVKFSDSGKSLITLFSTSNASTVFHESSHIFRRYLPNLSPELSAQANKFVKAAGDIWSREQEELWATSFEKYLLTGEPPTKKMESVFASTKAWMLDVYRNVVGGVNDINLDPSLKNVFDQMLGGLNAPGPVDTLNQTFKQALKDAAKNGASPVQALQQAVHGTFNLNHIKTTADVRKVFEGMADEVLTQVNKLKGDKQTHAEWLKYAEKVGVKDLLQTLDATGKGMNNIAAQVVGGKMLAARIGVSVAELGQRLLSLETAGKVGAEFTSTKAQFADARQGMARVLMMVNALQRESARAVNAGNVDIKITQALKEVDLKAATDFFSDIDTKVDEFEKAFDEYANPPKPEPTPKAQESGGKSSVSNDPASGPTMPQDQSVPEGTPSATKGPQMAPEGSNAKQAVSGDSPAGATVANPAITPGLTPNERVFISNILDAMNAEQFDAVTQVFDLRDAKAIDAAMELWVANLLSGVKTQSVNALGNVINTLSQPLMRAIGEGVSLRGREAVRALGMYHQLGMAMRDMVHLSRLKGPDGAGFASVWKALKYETSMFDRNVEGLAKPSFTAKAFGVKNKAGAGVLNAIGTAARAPGLRVLGAVDEVFQNLNYIAHIRSDAIKQAQNLVEQGLMQADQIEGHVSAHVKNAFRKGGANVGAPIYAAAYKYAKDVGFKTPLGRFGESIAKLKRDHPLLGFIIPFVRVPLNITKTAVRMTPGVGILEYLGEAAGEKLTRSQLARRRGEVVAGMGVWGFAAYAYSQGMITGGGPQNPDERKLWMAAGNQPYSVVVTGDDGKKRYISYARADPFSSSLGIVADAFEAMPYMAEGDADKAAVLIVQSFVKNSISKTYLKGVNDFTRAMSDVRYIPSWARNTLASGLVPASVAQFTLSDDDGLREVNSMTEAIKRRIPGLSKDLPPRRNVLGEITTPPGGWLPFVGAESPLNHTLGARMLSPAALSEQSSDPVITELATLRHGITMPAKKIENVDLTGVKTESGQQAYDRWLELTGTITPGGRTLHQSLELLINSKSYQQLPPASVSDPLDNPRMKAVGRVMSRYREAAKQQLYKEVPELRDQIQENLRVRASRMRSGIDAAITWAGQ